VQRYFNIQSEVLIKERILKKASKEQFQGWPERLFNIITLGQSGSNENYKRTNVLENVANPVNIKSVPI
jgi:hypothetical protein